MRTVFVHPDRVVDYDPDWIFPSQPYKFVAWPGLVAICWIREIPRHEDLAKTLKRLEPQTPPIDTIIAGGLLSGALEGSPVVRNWEAESCGIRGLQTDREVKNEVLRALGAREPRF